MWNEFLKQNMLSNNNVEFFYLNIPIFPREKYNDGQAANYNAWENQNDCSHHPVEGNDARTFVFTGFASFGAGQTFKHSCNIVLTALALKRKTMRAYERILLIEYERRFFSILYILHHYIVSFTYYIYIYTYENRIIIFCKSNEIQEHAI